MDKEEPAGKVEASEIDERSNDGDKKEKVPAAEKPEEKNPEKPNNNNLHFERPHVKEEVAVIRVSGYTYELELDDIRRAPSSRLYKTVFVGKAGSLSFNRPIQSFESVLTYYQTGELHMPLSVCPGAFKTELTFWGLDPQIMAKCCYYRYLSHLDNQETLDKFHLHLFPEIGQQQPPMRWLKNCRTKLWHVLDNIDDSFFTKLYFYICTFMVILSVLTLALSTLPYFRRGLTRCEVEEMLGRKVQFANGTWIENDTCTEPLPDAVYNTIVVDADPYISKVTMSADTTQAVTTQSSTEVKNKTVLGTRSGMFNFDFSEDTVSNEQLVDHIVSSLNPHIGLEKRTVRIESLIYIDTALLAFFTMDLCIRVLCCPSIRRYFLSTINIIDALVVLSAYAHIVINLIRKSEKYENTNYDLLETLQVLRVVRLLRLVRNVTGFKVLTFSLKVSMKDLLVLCLYLLLGIAIFANFIYFVENGEDFTSIPVGWWWAINTLTTVGYGDIVPMTLYGRLIGAVCAISGVVLISVAIPVFVQTFMLLYAYAVLYKKSLNRPDVTHRFIYRQVRLINHNAQQAAEKKK